MGQKNFYELLGLVPGATDPEIKRAYHKLARKHHPDAAHDTQSKAEFEQLAQAYEVLSDPAKRVDYDTVHGFDVIPRTLNNEKTSANGSAESTGESNRARDILNGQVRNEHSTLNSARFSGADLSQFDENSLTNRIKSGISSFKDALTKKQSKEQDEQPFAATELLRGERQYLFTIDALESLKGVTRELAIQSDSGVQVIKVMLEPGIAHGAIVHVNCPSTDPKSLKTATVKVSVSPHPLVLREGNDVTLRVPITVSEAILGIELEVPTVGGSVKIRIPAGSNSAKRLRLRGKGVNNIYGLGDFYIQPVITPPDSADDSVKAAAKVIDRAYNQGVRKDLPKSLG